MAEDSDKTVFNERMLAKLLEAAYVVQEHNRTKQSSPAPAPERQKSAVDPARQVPPPALSDAQYHDPDPVNHASAPVPTEIFPAKTVSPEPARAASPAATASDDYAATLALIVETQRQMREHPQQVDNPMTLVAERVSQIARAGGAAVGILEGENIRYRGTAGLMTPSAAEVSNPVNKEKALCAVCLKTGQVMRCSDVGASILVDATECKRRGIRAMIAVPVFHEGAVGGALELYYETAQAFTEQDVHTAQLMAGLVTEALAREEEATRRKSLAGERALMLEALEKLQPNLAALADASAAKVPASKSTGATTPSKVSIVCAKCGHDLLDEEQFCGKCGASRGDYQAPSMQSKVASMWHMQEALKKQGLTPGLTPTNGASTLAEPATGFDDAEFEKMLTASLEKEMPELFQAPAVRSGKMWPETLEPPHGSDLEAAAYEDELEADAHDESARSGAVEDEEELSPATALAKPDRNLDWSSAASAREFLEQLAEKRSNGLARFWHARRGDFYLALAVILVAIVIRWGIWSNHPVGATGKTATTAAQHHKPAADADRSWFDRTLIKLGLAEAPEPVQYKGNPDTEVWVDLHTALYYCPGTDLYGKTPKGKFATQRDAQLDQFEPAYRKACD